MCCIKGDELSHLLEGKRMSFPTAAAKHTLSVLLSASRVSFPCITHTHTYSSGSESERARACPRPCVRVRIFPRSLPLSPTCCNCQPPPPPPSQPWQSRARLRWLLRPLSPFSLSMAHSVQKVVEKCEEANNNGGVLGESDSVDVKLDQSCCALQPIK